MGLPLRGPHLHVRLVATPGWRTRVHRQRLWREGVHHLEVQGRPGRRAALDDTGRRAATDARRHDRRVRELRTRGRRTVGRAARRGPDRGNGHALLVGHDRSSEGSDRPVRRGTPRVGGHRCHTTPPDAVRGRRHQDLSVAGALLPRRPLAFLPGDARHRRHDRGDGELRCRGVPAPHRALRRDPQPGRADDVRPHAQAAGRRSREV